MVKVLCKKTAFSSSIAPYITAIVVVIIIIT